jgi:hypothetical protein
LLLYFLKNLPQFPIIDINNYIEVKFSKSE